MSLKNRPKREEWQHAPLAYDTIDGMNYAAHVEECFVGLEKKLADLLDDDKVCDGCGFFDHCEDVPYDCNAMDALRQIAGKEET